jgi:hypothetical protein
VLGAGASAPYGFPTGPALAGKIIRDFREDNALQRAIVAAGGDQQLMEEFARRAGISRSVAMQLTGHKTEAVYHRYAITSEADLREGVDRLNGDRDKTRGQSAECKAPCQGALRVNR